MATIERTDSARTLELTTTVRTEPGFIQVVVKFDSTSEIFDSEEFVTQNVRITADVIQRLQSEIDGITGQIADQLGVPTAVLEQNANVRTNIPEQSFFFNTITVAGGLEDKTIGTHEIGVDTDVGRFDLGRTTSFPATIPPGYEFIAAEYAFQPARVLVREGERDLVDRIDSQLRANDSLPKISVASISQGTLRQTIFTSYPRTVTPIPVNTFIERVPVSSLDCSEIYPQIKSELENIENSAETVDNSVDESLSQLREIANTLVSATGVEVEAQEPASPRGTRLEVSPGPGETDQDVELAQRLEQITVEDLTQNAQDITQSSIGQDVLSGVSDVGNELREFNSRIRERVRGISAEPGANLGRLERRFNSVEGQVGSVGVPDCSDEFSSSVEQTQDLLELAQTRSQNAQELKDAILRVVNLQVSSSALDCAQEIPSSIDQRVSNWDADTSEFISDPFSEGIRDELITEASDINSEIDSLDIPEECKTQLRERIDPTLSQLQDVEISFDCAQEIGTVLQTRIQNFGQDSSSFASKSIRERNVRERRSLIQTGESLIRDIRSSDMPSECENRFTSRVRNNLRSLRQLGVEPTGRRRDTCASRNPDLQDDIEDFESDVLDVDSSDTQAINSLIDEGESLITRVSDGTNGRCSKEFSDSIRAALDRLDSKLRQEARVTTREQLEEEIDETASNVEDLRDQLDEIQIPEGP